MKPGQVVKRSDRLWVVLASNGPLRAIAPVVVKVTHRMAGDVLVSFGMIVRTASAALTAAPLEVVTSITSAELQACVRAAERVGTTQQIVSRHAMTIEFHRAANAEVTALR